MRVIIYVEGISDKTALTVLFERLIKIKAGNNIYIDIFESPKGNKKYTLLTKVPLKAANIVTQLPDSIVIAIPDLHPFNVAFPHETPEQIQEGMYKIFLDRLSKKRIKNPGELTDRFKIFCFKFEMEVLLLACEEGLKSYLKTNNFDISWIKPVENQNDNIPPKQIISRLFEANNKKYHEAVDTALILQNCSYEQLKELCPQCFRPFAEYLERL